MGLAFKKKSQNNEPVWFTKIKNDIQEAQRKGLHECHGYAPVGQEKLLMTLKHPITFKLEMWVQTDDGGEYYYKFNF